MANITIPVLEYDEKKDSEKLVINDNISTIELELENYVKECINIKPYNNNILELMDGSSKATLIYESQKEILDNLYNITYNVKFKEVAPSSANSRDQLKHIIFDKWFQQFNEMINSARIKNMEMAKKIIQPHMDKYNKKFDMPVLTIVYILSKSIMQIQEEAFLNLNQYLITIDNNVQKQIINMIADEKKVLDEIQQEITKKNNNQIKMMNELINTYNANAKVNEYIDNIICKQIEDADFNVPMEYIIEDVEYLLQIQ
jgi:hypothetical protein